jgi:hypothetical protein
MLLEPHDSSRITADDLDDITRSVQDKALARRKVHVRQLSILADGEELPLTFDVYAAKSITFEVDEGTRKLEVNSRQEGGDVPLAIQWLDWNDPIARTRKSFITLEGGQQFDFSLTNNKDDYSRITHALMNITYSEQARIKSLRLGLMRCISGLRNRQRVRFWSWIPIAAEAFLMVVCVLAGILLYEKGRRPQPIVTQDTNQKKVIANSGLPGTPPVPANSSLQADGPRRDANNTQKTSAPAGKSRLDALTASRNAQNRERALVSRRRESTVRDVTKNQPPDSQVAVASRPVVPNETIYPDDKTRTADPRPLDIRLLEVKSVYVDPSSFQDQTLARTIYNIFDGNQGLIKISRFSVTEKVSDSDAVLRGTVRKVDSGWEVSVRLVNRPGSTVWSGFVIVSGPDDQQVAEEAVRRLLERLQTDLHSKQAVPDK